MKGGIYTFNPADIMQIRLALLGESLNPDDWIFETKTQFYKHKTLTAGKGSGGSSLRLSKKFLIDSYGPLPRTVQERG